ncbi:MAG: SRPBCC domain-containing protein [Gemmatimonadaceae bacterium]
MSAGRSSSAAPPREAPADELLLTRIFDAPRELVFEAFTKNEHLARWQGAPKGFTTTVEKSDIRPGGEFLICMHAPDGVDHWLQGVYREVVPPSRLVFTHAWLDAEKHPKKDTLVVITFADKGGKTELTLRQTGLPSAASRDGHASGWESTFDRLHDYLETIR